MIRCTKIAAVLAGAMLAAGPATAQTAGTLEADLILSNGEIRTPDGWAQALAIKNGIIIAVGDEQTVAKHKAAQTRTRDLKGAAVVPGLQDMHVHPMGSGMMQQQCIFPQGSTPTQVIDAVKACVAKRAKGEWIVGGQWDTASFGRTRVHRSLLDRVSPDNPVALTDISIHSLWVNSKALELAGITAATQDPPGGVIERDAKGQPTGVLRESAGGLVRTKIPPSTPQQSEQALRWALDYMLSNGITSFSDAGVDESILQAYAKIADAGDLKLRVRACQGWRPSLSPGGDDVSEYELRRTLYARERLSPDCIKIGLDGVPTDGHTAAMLEPYADAKDPSDPRAKGISMVPEARLKQAVIDFDARGFTVKMHAAGDAAVREGLNAIEAARKANGFSGRLHDMSHNSFVHMDDIRRARDIAATFEMSPYIWYPNPIIPDIAKAIGPERMKRWTPVKDAIDAGALVVPGSDWAVVPSINPWLAMETLVTRQKPGGGGETLGEAERITLQQAFDMFTVNAARQMGNAGKTGAIRRGLYADVLVLDRNPFKIPVTQIHQTRATAVLINGEVVYEAGQGQ